MATAAHPPFKNIYHLRRVAEASQKPCVVCYKPTSVVLVSEDGKNDFFYVCQTHLADRGFASPVVNAAAEAAKRRQEELEKEMELVKKEWEKRQKTKKSDRDAKAKERRNNKDNDKKAEQEELDAQKTEDRRDKGEHREQLRKLEEQKEEAKTKAEQEQRVFHLNKDIYGMRVNNWRNIQRSKRTAELLRKPGGLPSVPMRSPGDGSNDTPTAPASP
ncbi:VPS4-associated protein 1 [Limtongia smithiae]|uniref:VPS4-associated protein 1 n=1 Tax=Limtongia smithiae TaxID=1125753 RepID=UPI0034CF911E